MAGVVIVSNGDAKQLNLDLFLRAVMFSYLNLSRVKKIGVSCGTGYKRLWQLGCWVLQSWRSIRLRVNSDIYDFIFVF